MAIELDDGTIVRSLPEQVDFLTTANENNEIAIDNLTARLEAAIAGVLHYKGSVPTYADLPADAEIGDVYNVIDTGANYAWTGSEWDELGMTVDLNNLYARNADLIPTENQTYKIGAGDKKFLSIYTIDMFLSKANKNASNRGFILPSNQYLTADSEILTSLTTQTVNAVKKFKENTFWLIHLDDPNEFHIQLDMTEDQELRIAKVKGTNPDIIAYLHQTYWVPSSDNATILGLSNRKFKQVNTYIVNLGASGSLRDGNNANYGYTLPDSTGLTANSELLDTASAQKISGVKAIKELFTMLSADESYTIYIKNSGWNNLDIGLNTNTDHYRFSANFFKGSGRDLGTSSAKWKDLYLSGNISDGTNSVNVADLKALIDYAKAQGWIS